MSDYLANLVTRSVGPAEGVRPRLAALFEPPRGLGGALMGAGAEAELAAAEVAAEQPMSAGTPRERVPERQATAHPALARTPVAAPQSAPVAPLGQQVAHTPTLPAFIVQRASGDALGRAAPPQAPSIPVASALSPALVASAEHSSRRPDRLSAPLVPLDRSAPGNQREQRGARVDSARASWRESLIERIVIEHNVPAELRSANADAPQPAQRPDPRQPTIAVAAPIEPPVVSQTTPPSLIVRAEPPTGLIARPLPAAISVQPRLPSHGHGEPAEAASAEPPTPIIQVTIGRIDVRATPAPAAPAQRQRATPPVMGLDDYLRQRAKRGSG